MHPVYSCYVEPNARVFPRILRLHVPAGSTVADVTYGQGVFWREVPTGTYELLASDLKSGTDCRALPYKDESVDCVVLDPPYMEGLHRQRTRHLAGTGTHRHFRARYSNGKPPPSPGAKWHGAVIDLYVRAGEEAWRVLRPNGVLIVKCQDEVSANRQYLTHFEILAEYVAIGYYAKDLFVVVRSNRPSVRNPGRQVHARKNHSYFIVFVKKPGSNGRNRWDRERK